MGRKRGTGSRLGFIGCRRRLRRRRGRRGRRRGIRFWPYRVPSLLGGVAAVLGCYAVGRRVFGGRAALLGAGMLAAAAAVVGEVHIAKTDAALLGATTAAMALLGRAYLDPGGFGRRAAAGFWLLMGVGVLLKGPITPMVAGLACLTLVVGGLAVGGWGGVVAGVAGGVGGAADAGGGVAVVRGDWGGDAWAVFCRCGGGGFGAEADIGG